MSVEIRYVKRILMAFDFTLQPIEVPELPHGFFWTPWRDTLVKIHAKLVHTAFSKDLDGRIFPTFRQYSACEHLVHATVSARSFVPEATWLIGNFLENKTDKRFTPFEYCAAIQCECKKKRIGEIQNISVHPNKRRQGLGRILTLKALNSFQNLGAKRVILEVTAENAVALRMYASIGFHPLKYFYTETFVENNIHATYH